MLATSVDTSKCVDNGHIHNMHEILTSFQEFSRATENLYAAEIKLHRSLTHGAYGTAYQVIVDQLYDCLCDLHSNQGSASVFLARLADCQNILDAFHSDGSINSDRMCCAKLSCYITLLLVEAQKQFAHGIYNSLSLLTQNFTTLTEDKWPTEITNLLCDLGLNRQLLSCSDVLVPIDDFQQDQLSNERFEDVSLLPRDHHSDVASSELIVNHGKLPADHSKPTIYVDGLPDVTVGIKHSLESTTHEPTQLEHFDDKTNCDLMNFISVSTSNITTQTGLSHVIKPKWNLLCQKLDSSSIDNGCDSGTDGLCYVSKSSGDGLQPFSSPIFLHHHPSSPSGIPLMTMTDEVNNEFFSMCTLENSTSRSGLATDDELDSIVNMLSGCMTCPCSSPSHSNPVTPISMLSMPDDHLQEASRTASLNSLRDYGVARTSVQLTVPVPHRLRSPASDSQVDEMRSPKLSRTHRRSDGCLDLFTLGHALSGDNWYGAGFPSSSGALSTDPDPHCYYDHWSSSPTAPFHSGFLNDYNRFPAETQVALSCAEGFLPNDFLSRPPPGFQPALETCSFSGGEVPVDATMGGNDVIQKSVFLCCGVQSAEMQPIAHDSNFGSRSTVLDPSGIAHESWMSCDQCHQPFVQQTGLHYGVSLDSSQYPSGINPASDGYDDSSRENHLLMASFRQGQNIPISVDHKANECSSCRNVGKVDGDGFTVEQYEPNAQHRSLLTIDGRRFTHTGQYCHHPRLHSSPDLRFLPNMEQPAHPFHRFVWRQMADAVATSDLTNPDTLGQATPLNTAPIYIQRNNPSTALTSE